jgi:DNA-binding NtrC family response regulator
VLTQPETCPHGSVLIVDDSEDSREVLRTALQRLGVQTFEATEARQGVRLAHQHHPQVIVLDLEAESAEDEGVRLELDAQSRGDDGYLVVLGRSISYEETLPKDCIVPKPYHYGPLVRTIERLLSSSRSS